MYNCEQIIRGLTKFIDVEIVPKMSGLQKWAFGTMCGIALKQGKELLDEYKDHDILKKLNVVEDGMINVDLIYDELKNQARESSIDIDVPMIGRIKLNHSDVDALYRYIVEA